MSLVAYYYAHFRHSFAAVIKAKPMYTLWPVIQYIGIYLIEVYLCLPKTYGLKSCWYKVMLTEKSIETFSAILETFL